MEYEFEYKLKQTVTATSYDDEQTAFRGVVIRRWLEENPPYMENHGLQERYIVLIKAGLGLQECEFLAEDLQPVD